MKKILLTAFVALISVFFTSAKAGITRSKMDKETRKQVRKEKREKKRLLWLHTVNVATEAQFYTDFPEAKDVNWTEKDFAEASFLDNSVLKTAYYDLDNALVGTTTLVDFSALPKKAKEYIDKKYPGYTVKQMILFDDNEASNTDMNLFSSPFEDADNYFPMLSKGTTKIILKVKMDGNVSFFKKSK